MTALSTQFINCGSVECEAWVDVWANPNQRYCSPRCRTRAYRQRRRAPNARPDEVWTPVASFGRWFVARLATCRTWRVSGAGVTRVYSNKASATRAARLAHEDDLRFANL